MEFLWMTLAAVLAFTLGRSALIWGFLGYAVGWPAAVIVFFLGIKKDRYESRLASLNMLSGRLLNQKQSAIVKKEIKDFDTVDDLFKQLKTK